MKKAMTALLFSAALFCGAPGVVAANQEELLQQDPKKSYGAVDVILYETTWCPSCQKAHAYLKDLGVSLVVYDVEQDAAKHEEMIAKSGSRGVPVIDIEGIILRGYSKNAIKTAVEQRRRQ
jgi:glutaredoxin